VVGTFGAPGDGHTAVAAVRNVRHREAEEVIRMMSGVGMGWMVLGLVLWIGVIAGAGWMLGRYLYLRNADQRRTRIRED
jgi:hypothetical protein